MDIKIGDRFIFTEQKKSIDGIKPKILIEVEKILKHFILFKSQNYRICFSLFDIEEGILNGTMKRVK